jgi:hypothetical protein
MSSEEDYVLYLQSKWVYIRRVIIDSVLPFSPVTST